MAYYADAYATSTGVNLLYISFYIAPNTDYIEIRFGGNGTTVLSMTTNAGSLVQDQWHHITMTKNNNGAAVYINNTLAASGTFNFGATTLPNLNALTLGAMYYDGLPINDFNGSIDDVRIYQQELSTTAIDSLFNDDPTVVIPPVSTREFVQVDFRIAPNPASNYIQLQGLESQNIENVEILNISGQVIYSNQFNYDNIDVSNLDDGLYLLRVYTKDGQQGVQRFIKY